MSFVITETRGAEADQIQGKELPRLWLESPGHSRPELALIIAGRPCTTGESLLLAVLSYSELYMSFY